jgi:hypothetical protein
MYATDKNFDDTYNLAHTNLFLLMIDRMDMDYKSAQINQNAADKKGDIKEYQYWTGVVDQLITSMNDLKSIQTAVCGHANWKRTYAEDLK